MSIVRTCLRVLLAAGVAAGCLFLLGVLAFRISMARDGLQVDLGNNPVHIVGSHTAWLEYVLVGVVTGAVIASSGRRSRLMPAATAGFLAIGTVALLISLPDGEINPFWDGPPSALVLGQYGAQSTAVILLIAVLATLAIRRWREQRVRQGD